MHTQKHFWLTFESIEGELIGTTLRHAVLSLRHRATSLLAKADEAVGCRPLHVGGLEDGSSQKVHRVGKAPLAVLSAQGKHHGTARGAACFGFRLAPIQQSQVLQVGDVGAPLGAPG